MKDQAVDCCVLLLYWFPLVKANLVSRVEHSDLPPDAATGQDVGVLVAELQGGPGDVFV